MTWISRRFTSWAGPAVGLLLVAPFVGLLAAPAAALPVAYHATVGITDLNDPFGILAPYGVTTSSILSVTYVFESTTPDADPDPTQGAYLGGVVSMQVLLEGTPLTLSGASASSNTMFFVNDYLFGASNVDGYAADVTEPNVTVGVTPMDSLQMAVYVGSTDTSILSDDSMQTTQPPNPAGDYDAINLFRLFGSAPTTAFLIDGVVTGLAPVPEPSLVLPLAAGATLAGISRRR